MTPATDKHSNVTDRNLPASEVLVAVTHQVDYELECALSYGVGVEIQVFSLPENLARDYQAYVDRIAGAVREIKGPVGSHGPFIDMTHYSTDEEIRKVCKKRYIEALNIAETLGAFYVVFHSQFNPAIKVEKYRQIYLEESLRFWPEVIREAERRGIRIYIENMFDTSPEPMVQVVAAIDSPAFRLCLDVAHASIHGGLNFGAWLEAFRPYLDHVHMNDCMGEYDDHLGLGQGTLELAEAIRKLKQMGRPLTYALETGEHTEASLEYLGIHKPA